jgi:hypothetical protein
MPDYTSSLEPARGHRSSRNRTLNWVHNVPRQEQFSSPSFPPTPVGDMDDVSAFSDSDAESSHSTPPRMLLRYPDGRDVHISHDYPSNKRVHGDESMNRASSRPYDPRQERGAPHSRIRSASAMPQRVSNDHGDRVIGSSPHSRTSSRDSCEPPTLVSSRMPAHPSRPSTAQAHSMRPQEDIRVLPTFQTGTSHGAAYGASRNPAMSHLVSPTPHRAYAPSQVAVTQSQPPGHFRPMSAPPPMSHSQSHPPSKYGHLPVRAPDPRRQPAYTPSGLSNTYTSSSHGPSSRSGRAHMPVTYSGPSSPNHARARSGSVARSRNPTTGSMDSWTIIDEDEIRGDVRRPPGATRSHQSRSQHGTQRSHHRDDSSSDESPPALDYSRSRTPSSGSQSTYYVNASPGHRIKPLVSSSCVCITLIYADVLRSRLPKNPSITLLFTTKVPPRYTSQMSQRSGLMYPTEPVSRPKNRS